jgi:hypothetical protein
MVSAELCVLDRSASRKMLGIRCMRLILILKNYPAEAVILLLLSFRPVNLLRFF